MRCRTRSRDSSRGMSEGRAHSSAGRPVLACELEAGIRRSGKFIFVISPESVRSPMCRRELGFARRPAQAGDTGHAASGPRTVDPGGPGGHQLGFLRRTPPWRACARLIGALDSDLDISARHARLLVRAAGWFQSGRRSQLLRGDDLKAYEGMLVRPSATRPGGRRPSHSAATSPPAGGAAGLAGPPSRAVVLAGGLLRGGAARHGRARHHQALADRSPTRPTRCRHRPVARRPARRGGQSGRRHARQRDAVAVPPAPSPCPSS